MKFLNKITYRIFLVILTINLISCQSNKDSKMEYKIIDFNKIQGEKLVDDHFNALNRYKFNQIINYNKDIFFLLGDDSGENSDNYNAIVYSTKNFGDSFHKTILGKGTVSEGYFTGKNLFVILVNREFIDGANQVSSSLFMSKDFGETWERINNFNNESVIESLNFYNNRIGIAHFYNNINDTEEYRYTVDGGETWTKFEIDDANFDSITNCLFKTNTVIWFISDNNLISYNLITKELKIEKKLPVPKGMKSFAIYKDEKNGNPITFFGYDDNDEKGEIYYILEDKHVTIENGFGNVYGNFMYKFIDNNGEDIYIGTLNKLLKGKIDLDTIEDNEED